MTDIILHHYEISPYSGKVRIGLGLKARYRKPGQVVSVTPDDTGRDPVIGELVTSGIHEIVIRRSDPAIGEVCVHFPRAGFVVT